MPDVSLSVSELNSFEVPDWYMVYKGKTLETLDDYKSTVRKLDNAELMLNKKGRNDLNKRLDTLEEQLQILQSGLPQIEGRYNQKREKYKRKDKEREIEKHRSKKKQRGDVDRRRRRKEEEEEKEAGKEEF